MSVVVDVIVPIFGLVALGYAATFTPVFDEAAARGLSAFVFYFALPIALFHALATTALPDTYPFGFLAAYYLGTALMFLPAFVCLRGAFDRKAILGFGSAYSNTVLLGIPLVITALGPTASVPVFLLISFHSVLFFTLVTVLVEGSRGLTTGLARLPLTLLRSLATNLFLITILAGLAFTGLGWRLPAAVDRGFEFMAGAAFPGALFSMGASLRRYKIAGALATANVMMAVKLGLHPLVVAALVWLFGVTGVWAQTAILCAAMPMGINTYLFAVRYRLAEAEVATAILLSNIVSMATLAITLWLLGIGR